MLRIIIKLKDAVVKEFKTDQNEIKEPHGQRIGNIFHDADFIVNVDTSDKDSKEQVDRFCVLVSAPWQPVFRRCPRVKQAPLPAPPVVRHPADW